MRKIDNWTNRNANELEDEAWQKSYFKEMEKRQENGEFVISNRVARVGITLIQVSEHSRIQGKDLFLAENWEKDNFKKDTEILQKSSEYLKDIIRKRKQELNKLNQKP